MRCIYSALLILAVSAEPVVKTLLGSVTGKIEKVIDVDVESFREIPYAKPPLGDLRFSLPVPFGEIGDFDATKSSKMCPQILVPVLKMNAIVQDEDCLKLNIFRKAGTSNDAKKAVIIFVHGGGYAIGSGSDSYQTPVPLAAQEDLIVVTINYRLGVLGFADMKGLAPANIGLHDQRLAFKWVHDNIESFGGDPNRVTLMGVSAGSMSVGAQIITPLNKERYFQSVIMDGGAVNGFGFIENSDQSFKKIQKVAERVNCPIDGDAMLKCLKEKDAQELVQKSDLSGSQIGLSHFVATRDGTFIPQDLEMYLKGNNFANVKAIIGYTKDEGSIFVHLEGEFVDVPLPNLQTLEDFTKWVEMYINVYKYPMDLNDEHQKQAFVEEYYNKYSGTFNVTSAFQGDGVIICPVNYFIKQIAKQHNNIYVYQFDREVQQTYFGFLNPNTLGVFHYLPHMHFSGAALDQTDVAVPDEDRKYFLDSMKLIGNFVKSDDAPTFRNVIWPDYSKTGEIMILNETPSIRKGLTREETTCKRIFSPQSDLCAETASDGNCKTEL